MPSRKLLVTDIDGTLVGDPDATRRLAEVLAALREHVILAYATGRTLRQCEDLAANPHVIQPDVWVTEVGAAIRYADEGPDEAWRAKMAETWHRETVVQVVAGWPELTPQSAIADGPFKVPFQIAPHDAALVLPKLAAQLLEAGTPARLVYSSQRDLDIIPAAAGKGPAVQHLARRFGLGLEDVLTCGDSANDRDMLVLGGPAVAVANAHAELTESGLPGTVLRARAGFADGVVEALRHYGWV
ncbi:MAG: spp [Cyanobacteria bacterium RYN_339]|nr:spp [Cyanobacteria bacterium RYN_339]